MAKKIMMGILFLIGSLLALGLLNVWGLPVIFGALAVYLYHSGKVAAAEIEPTRMVCPNCGNRVMDITTITDSETKHNSGGGLLFGTLFNNIGAYGSTKGKKKYLYAHEARCRRCGYLFEFRTEKETEELKRNLMRPFKKMLIVCGCSIAFSACTSIAYISSDSSAGETNMHLGSDTSNLSENQNKSVWSSTVTPLSSFEYYLEGDSVYLTDYIGKEKKVRIGTEYEIDGKIYHTDSHLEDLFVASNVDSVIIPEGITSVENNIFNSCGVKYVYIPKTLIDGGEGYCFYDYFHDVQKIYYGGTKEEWAVLTNNADRSAIDAVEIVYDAKVEDLY